LPSLKISVIIPTYNRAESLLRTLRALAGQTFPARDFEVIVISDGSTDETPARLAEMEKAFQQSGHTLRPIQQQNAGPACARNRGIREATGELIVFVDDDVEPIKEFLAIHAARQEGQQKRVVVGPLSPDPALRWKEPAWIAWEHAMLERQYVNFRSGAWPTAGPNHFYSGNASVRREHLLAVGGFDETFKRQEDVELAYRLERDCGLSFQFAPDAIGIHRPMRRFASWSQVPYAYGKLDVVRAQRGDVDWEIVQHSYHSRSRPTRFLADKAMPSPRKAAQIEKQLEIAARLLYGLHAEKPAFAVLSALFNLRYLDGVAEQLGSPEAVQNVLWGKPASTTSPTLTPAKASNSVP
jgi:glycosyltransferase involved in cell wall biosynthesis